MKNCPFCGGTARMKSTSGCDYGRDVHRVVCDKCGTLGPAIASEYHGPSYEKAQQQALALWEKRS